MGECCDGRPPALSLPVPAAVRLLLDRQLYESESTVGDLYVNGEFECYVMEPGTREISHPAIPEGIYPVKLTVSPKFKRVLPLICDVPGRDGIRIHPGNTDDQTLGCLMPGEEVIFKFGMPFMVHSVPAFARLFEKLNEAAENHEELTLEVVA